MSEPLENEIEEELRKKQLKVLWDRFGLYLIAVILIIIMSFGGYEFSKYLGYKNSENSSDQYEKALAVLDNENNNDAIDIFESLLGESNGYSGLSLFNLSNIAIKEGNKVLALEYLARAAIAVGVASVFMETHPDPDNAPSDGPNMVPLSKMESLLKQLISIDKLIKNVKNN